jgi:hypothetical protein
MQLPVGYVEYVTTLGPGELCDFLHVKMPKEINGAPYNRKMLLELAAHFRQGAWHSDLLSVEDLEEAFVFASSAERPLYLACRRLGPLLFELCDDWTQAMPNGFFGLVDQVTVSMRHDFPFFEPWNGRRKMRGFAVRAGFGLDGFLDAVAGRWGREGLQVSRRTGDEASYPHLFIPAIEGQFGLYLDTAYTRLPAGCFFVRATYDIASEREVAAFVASVFLPGGTSWTT